MEPLHCVSGEYIALQYDVIFTQISMLTKVSNPVVVYEARVVESFYSDFLLKLRAVQIRHISAFLSDFNQIWVILHLERRSLDDHKDWPTKTCEMIRSIFE